MNVKGTSEEEEGITMEKLGRPVQPESGKRTLNAERVCGTKHGPGEGTQRPEERWPTGENDCVQATLGHGRETRRDQCHGRDSQGWPERSLQCFMIVNSMPLQERMDAKGGPKAAESIARPLILLSRNGWSHFLSPVQTAPQIFRGDFFVFF